MYASLAASLLSALLAMLGKQWLNRYISTDMRGTAIERSQNRQRKLNGIDGWHFEYVMGSLPLMLQAALLLFGCALCRYLWEANATVASVVLGVTALGVIFYIFIVVAGAASESCPYQTPGSRVLRSAPSAFASATSTVASVFGRVSEHSKICSEFQGLMYCVRDRSFGTRVRFIAPYFLRRLPRMLAIDTFRLGRAVVRLVVASVCRVYVWLSGTLPTPTHVLDQQTTMLDLQCVLWTLQTSLDKGVHLSTLESLATTIPLPDDFDPTLVTVCFNVFIGCVKVVDSTVVVTQGFEGQATASAVCLLHTFSHLSVVDPRSDVLEDVGQRYCKIFPPGTNFHSLPFSHTLGAMHELLNPDRGAWEEAHIRWNYEQVIIGWWDRRQPDQEHVILAHAFTKLSQSEYRRIRKVPDWILLHVLQLLSWDPLPPTPIVVDCLSIIAMDLGCDIMDPQITILDERYIHT